MIALVRFFSLFFEQEEFYCNPVELASKENGGVAVVRGHKVVKLDVVERKAVLDNGMEITYDKCLIATGKPNLMKSEAGANGEFEIRWQT